MPDLKREMMEVLATVEWCRPGFGVDAGGGYNYEEGCPVCGAEKGNLSQHREGCKLDALLTRLKSEPDRGEELAKLARALELTRAELLLVEPSIERGKSIDAANEALAAFRSTNKESEAERTQRQVFREEPPLAARRDQPELTRALETIMRPGFADPSAQSGDGGVQLVIDTSQTVQEWLDKNFTPEEQAAALTRATEIMRKRPAPPPPAPPARAPREIAEEAAAKWSRNARDSAGVIPQLSTWQFNRLVDAITAALTAERTRHGEKE